MEKIVQDHERRIADLEVNYKDLTNQITTIQGSQYKLENTILHESKEQKEILNRLLDHHLKVEESNHKHDQEMKKTNLNNKWKLTFTILGSGGLFYMFVEFLVWLAN